MNPQSADQMKDAAIARNPAQTPPSGQSPGGMTMPQALDALEAASNTPDAQDPKAKPTPQPDASWECDLKALDEKGNTADIPENLTVGTKLSLVCEGSPIELKRESLKIENVEQFKYSLILLETKDLKETGGSFIVTSWRASEMKFYPVLTDGSKRVDLGEIEFTVASSIDPQSNPEGKPYPPWSVLEVSWPLWVWMIGAIFGLALLGVIGFAVHISLRRKRLLKLLEKNPTALSPYNQFNKEFRKITRPLPTLKTWSAEEAGAFFTELESSFRWFITREMIIPAIDASPARVLKELKKSDEDTHKRVKKSLFLALSELEKARRAAEAAKTGKTSVKAPHPDDALQISELCRVLAHEITTERSA